MRGRRRWGQAVAVVVLVGIAAGADSPSRPRIPHAVNEIVRWLPENTETVAAVQGFNVEDVCDWLAVTEDAAPTTARMVLALLTLEDLGQLGPRSDRGLLGGAPRYLRQLGKNPVQLGVYGGRKYELYENAVWREACGILVFQRPLAVASKEFLEILHASAQGVRALARREVLCFARDTRRMPRRLKPDEGLFVAVPRPNVLVWSSSEPYLDEVLRRAGSPPLGRAVPDGLPEWNDIDPATGAWLVRHIPQRSNRPVLTGLSISSPAGQEGQLLVRYLTAAGAAEVELRKELMLGEPRAVRDGGTLVTTVDLRQAMPGGAEARSHWLGWFLSLNAALPDDLLLPKLQQLGRL